MPYQERPEQPKRVYQKGGPRIGGRFSSVLRGFGRGGGMVFKELTKKAPVEQKSPGTFSSKYFTEKHPYMQMEKARSIIGGIYGSKEEKQLVMLRLENQLYDASKGGDPYFSRKEGDQAIERTRELYGDKVAKEVEKKLEGAFRGKHTISGKEAGKYLSAINQYGPRVKEGIGYILENYNLKPQGGPQANYVTAEKLEAAIQKTEQMSGKHVAQSMREKFMVEKEGSSPEDKEVTPATGQASSAVGWVRWGRRSNRDKKS